MPVPCPARRSRALPAAPSRRKRSAGTQPLHQHPPQACPGLTAPTNPHCFRATPHHRPLGSPEQEAPRGDRAGPRCPGLSRTHPGGNLGAQRGTTGSPRQHLRRAPMPHPTPRVCPGARRVHMGPSPPRTHWGPQQRWKGSQGPRPSAGRARAQGATLPERGSSSGPALVRTAPSRAQPASPRCPDVSSGRRPPPPAAAPGGLPTGLGHRNPSLLLGTAGLPQPGMTQDPQPLDRQEVSLRGRGPGHLWRPTALTGPRPIPWPSPQDGRRPNCAVPPAWITGVSSMPQQGGPPSPAADLRGSTQVQGVPCKAGGRKQSPWVEAHHSQPAPGGLQDRV